MAVFYSDMINELFRNGSHGGKFSQESNALNVMVGTPRQSDLIEIQVIIENKRIKTARFKAHGKMTTLASAEYLCHILEGKTQDELSIINSQMLINVLKLPSYRANAALLAEEAVLKLAEQWRK